MAASVLIVDDHAGFRTFARALLEAEGFHVVGEAPDGASALALTQTLAPELVLLDVALPDMDGFEVCEALVEDGDNSPVEGAPTGAAGDDLLIAGAGDDDLVGDSRDDTTLTPTGNGNDDCRGDGGTDTAALCELVGGVP